PWQPVARGGQPDAALCDRRLLLWRQARTFARENPVLYNGGQPCLDITCFAVRPQTPDQIEEMPLGLVNLAERVRPRSSERQPECRWIRLNVFAVEVGGRDAHNRHWPTVDDDGVANDGR